MTLKLTRFARMILVPAPMSDVDFWAKQHLNISSTISFFVHVASVQLFQRGVEKQWAQTTRVAQRLPCIFNNGVERLIDCVSLSSEIINTVPLGLIFRFRFTSSPDTSESNHERIFRSTQTTEIPTASPPPTHARTYRSRRTGESFSLHKMNEFSTHRIHYS